MRLAITNLEVSFGERRVVDLAELAVGEAEIARAAGGPVPAVIAATGVAGLVGIIYLMVLKPF